MVAGCGSATPWTAKPVQNASFVIQPPMAGYVHDLAAREQREQVRDWAVIGSVVHLGATPAQTAAATYELPPARLPYLEELYSFEHGHGRRSLTDVCSMIKLDAGARGVIASLWPIEDAPSASVMTAVYRELASKPPSTALAAVQTAMRKVRPASHWAGLVFYGND